MVGRMNHVLAFILRIASSASVRALCLADNETDERLAAHSFWIFRDAADVIDP